MIAVTGSFDSMHAQRMRFLEEAAKLGRVQLYLWIDALVEDLGGHAPKFPQEERQYFLEAVRYVEGVTLVERADALPEGEKPVLLAVDEQDPIPPGLRAWCAGQGIPIRVIHAAETQGFPPCPAIDSAVGVPARKKVVVTGCYDWLHSGHVRFFEEAAAYGDLYVIVGNDANVRNLKGDGHPLYPQELRRYMASSIRFVRQALVTSGWGWMDGEPEIEALRPDIYLVNEDGDKPEKREFCVNHNLEYVVLKRLPRPGLERRSSTDLRGF
jgi:cytidyltransferase-like protein